MDTFLIIRIVGIGALVIFLGWLAIVDIRERRLPNRLVLAVAFLGLFLRVAECVQTRNLLPLGTAILGVLLSAGCAAGAAAMYYAVRREQGFGAGDLKLLAALGLSFGSTGFWILPIASVIAVLGELPRLIWQRIRKQHKGTVRKHMFAFGPYITLAAMALIAFGYVTR